MTDQPVTPATRLLRHADEFNNIRDRAIGLHLAILGAFEGQGNPDRRTLAQLAEDPIKFVDRACNDFEAIRADMVEGREA